MKSSKRLIFGAALVVAFASAPVVARAQYGGGMGSAGMAQQNMLDNLMNARSAGLKSGKSADHVIDAAKRGMADVDPRVRATALDKLRDVSDQRAQQLLLRGLVDPDIRVRIRAIDILGAQGDAAAVPLMTQQLFLSDTPSVVKLHIVAALGRIGDSRGTLPIISFLKGADNARSRGTAVFALGEIGDPRANAILVDTVTNDKSPMVRKLAQEAIEKIDGELPTARSEQMAAERAKQMIPTYQRLSKMRKVDEELQKLGE
jgi:HEAT repeat protein